MTAIVGVLLDDLLVAEDLAAAETTTAANHAAASAAATNVQSGRTPGRYAYNDERARQTAPESAQDGSVVLGTPVAPPVNGDMYTDISPENAVLQGQRLFSIFFPYEYVLVIFLWQVTISFVIAISLRFQY